MELNKLYTLKTNNSNRRMESQSYRDLNFKSKNIENIKNTKTSQNATSNYITALNGKRKHSKNKISTSETPKLRSQNEGLFAGTKTNSLQNDVDDDENQPSLDHNFSSNYNTRMLKKPPNHSSSNKHSRPMNTLK